MYFDHISIQYTQFGIHNNIIISLSRDIFNQQAAKILFPKTISLLKFTESYKKNMWFELYCESY